MKTKITLLTSAILLFANIALPTFSLAQVTQEWVSRYNRPGNIYDHARSVAVDDSGNVYVTGFNSSQNTGNSSSSDYVTVKYNSTGIEQWVAIYDGPANQLDDASSIAVDGSGNVYVTGRSCGNGPIRDYATLKYNSSGVQQWVARYNGPGNANDDATSLAVDDSGNVYVTGTSSFDYATIKYDSTGAQQWAARYSGPQGGQDYATSLAVDDSGNVYVTGYIAAQGISFDYATVKYNSSGVQQWVRIYNGPYSYVDFAYEVVVDGSGNVYVTGSSRGNGTSSDYATIKYNSSGAQQWLARYNGPGNGADDAYSLAVDNSGNVFVTGGSSGDYATIRYDSTGVQQWAARYSGGAARSLAVDGSGNVYVTGECSGDYATIKYNSTGDTLWTERYNGPGNGTDAASSLVVDGSGNVYVTGYSPGSGTTDDYATIKYSQQTVGIETIPAEFSLLQLFPNPATNQLTIALGSNNQKVRARPGESVLWRITITDITGKIIYSTIARETQKIEVNTKDFAEGIYIVQIQTADFIATKKLVVEK